MLQEKHLPLWIAALVLLLVAGIHGFSIGAPFHSDDYAYIVDNTRLQNLPAGELWRLATERFNPFEFLPLRDLSYRLDLALFGLDPAGFRGVNLALYLLACGLVYRVTRLSCEVLPAQPPAGAATIAAITTLLFCAHPSHVETVVWISGRKDLLAACLALASLGCALKAGSAAASAGRWILASLLLFVAALLSKAVSVALMPIYLGLALHFHRQPRYRLALRHVLLLGGLPALAAAGFMHFFHAASAITLPQYYGAESLGRFFAIIGWMARLAVSPEARYSFYPVVESGFLPMIGVGILGVGALLAAIVVAWRRQSAALLPLVLLLCLAMPYGQLLPFSTHSLVTDRYLFLFSWPVCLLLALAATTPPRRLAVALLALLWAVPAGLHALDWRDPDTLRARVLEAYPRHYLAIGSVVFGELLPRRQYRQAAELIGRIEDDSARALYTRYLALRLELDGVTAGSGEARAMMTHIVELQDVVKALPEQAGWNLAYRHMYAVFGTELVSEAWLVLAARHRDDAAVHFNAGLWLHDARDHAGAARMFAQAAALLGPQSGYRAVALKRHGISSWLGGDADKAQQLLLEAIAAERPDTSAFCALARLHQAQGRETEAATALRHCPRTTRLPG